MSGLKINTYGRIIEGDEKGWFLYIQNQDNCGNDFLILKMSSLDPTEGTGYDCWIETVEELKKWFEDSHVRVEWLDIGSSWPPQAEALDLFNKSYKEDNT